MKDDLLAAFSNSVRLRLLCCLGNEEKNVTQLISNCGLGQSAVSQHLEKLRNAGLVDTKRDGKEIYYKVISKDTVLLSKQILNFIEKYNRKDL